MKIGKPIPILLVCSKLNRFDGLLYCVDFLGSRYNAKTTNYKRIELKNRTGERNNCFEIHFDPISESICTFRPQTVGSFQISHQTKKVFDPTIISINY